MKKPNVILMYVDDLGYGDISCMNPKSKIITKNVDKLAEEGMRFTNAHTTASLCTPSRYGLLTGRYNWRSYLKKGVLFDMRINLIEEGRMTLASLFKNQGYRTACVGKWHLGMVWEKMDEDYEKRTGKKMADFRFPYKLGPNDCGFDYFYGIFASLNSAPHCFLENDRVVKTPDKTFEGYTKMKIGSVDDEMRFGVSQGPGCSDYDPEQCCPTLQKKVLSLIDRYTEGEEPFFIYYPTPAVHVPILPTDEFKGKSGIGPYGDFVLQMDSYVGELTSKLEEKGIADNTVFIFASDNGCCSMVDYPSLLRHSHNPSYIFRGYKGDIYEGGHRVPYIVKWPGLAPRHTETDQLVSMADIFRTFADYFGEDVPDNAAEDSVSNLPLWKGEDKPVRKNIAYSSMNGSVAIQQGPWKLEMCPGSGGESAGGFISNEPEDIWPKYQLYNMEADVGEQFNVVEREPEIYQSLRSELVEMICAGRSTPGKPQQNFGGKNYWDEIKWIREEK